MGNKLPDCCASARRQCKPVYLAWKHWKHREQFWIWAGQMLIFPGSGDVKIELQPGSQEIPLQKSPSGHLVMVIDDFEKVAKKGGVPEVPLQLHTSETIEAATSPPKAKL